MSLTEAFKVFGPMVGDRSIDSPRSQAAGVLHEELNRLVRRLGSVRTQDERDEVVARTLLGLVVRVKETSLPDPEAGTVTDSFVRSYLYAALKNRLKDHIRSKRPKLDGGGHASFAGLDTLVESGLENTAALGSPQGNPREAADETVERNEEAAEVQRKLEHYGERFDAELVPAAALASYKHERYRRAFLATIDELRAIQRGDLKFDELLASEAGERDTPRWRTVRGKYYQRYHRVLENLNNTLDAWRAAGKVDGGGYESLSYLIEELRLSGQD